MQDPKSKLIERILKLRRRDSYKRPELPFLSQNERRYSKLSFVKGTEFEKFVVGRFDPTYFTLIEWRSDKNIGDVYPLMSKFPDLEFLFTWKSDQLQFAIECKWREHFKNNIITLYEEQIENYKFYEEATKHPTFLVLGVGNEPSSPNEVYIIPIQKLERKELHEFSLGVFKRDSPSSPFFLDCKKRRLT